MLAEVKNLWNHVFREVKILICFFFETNKQTQRTTSYKLKVHYFTFCFSYICYAVHIHALYMYLTCYYMNLHKCYVYKNRNTYKTYLSNSLNVLNNCCAAIDCFPGCYLLLKQHNNLVSYLLLIMLLFTD